MASVGLDGVDVEAARTRGITVCNMPDICVDEVAEHTLAFLLASARKVPSWTEKSEAVFGNETRSSPWHGSTGRGSV